MCVIPFLNFRSSLQFPLFFFFPPPTFNVYRSTSSASFQDRQEGQHGVTSAKQCKLVGGINEKKQNLKVNDKVEHYLHI